MFDDPNTMILDLARKVVREGGLGRRVLVGSAESEAGPFTQVIPRRITCRENGKYVHVVCMYNENRSFFGCFSGRSCNIRPNFLYFGGCLACC